MKKIVLLIAIIITSFLSAQENQKSNEELRPYRVGLKIGVPSVVSLDLEYVTPLWDSRIAPFVSFSPIGFKVDDVKLNYTAFEIGSNIYFSKRGDGRGFYGALSYQHISAKLKQQNYEANDGRLFEGTTTSKISFDGLNTKVGVKVGRTMYFRAELGYSFGKIPKEIEKEGTFNGLPATDNENIEEDINTGGLPIFNIGFGYAF